LAFDRTLVQIRERSFLDVLDLALVVVRRWPVTLGLTALAGVAPFAVLNSWLLADPEFLFGWIFPLLALEAPWATAPSTVVLGGLMFGERPSAGRVAAILVRSFPTLFLYHCLLRSVLLITFVAYVLVPIRLGFLDEVILLERGRWWRAARRSADLSQRQGGALFGQWLAQLFTGGLFVCCFGMGAGKLARVLSGGELTWVEPPWADLRAGGYQVAAWLAIAFFGMARFFTYIDQRIRLEGWEVALRLRAVGHALEDDRRW
jgi:hypothetical protein